MATPDFDLDTSLSDVGEGSLGWVPATALAAGASRTIVPTHRLKWAIVQNLGAVSLIVASSKAMAEASHGTTLLPGRAITLTDLGGTPAISVYNPGAVAGSFDVTACLTRTPLGAMPAATSANSFPLYSAANPDAIRPGVTP